VALRHRALPIVGDACGKFRRELKLFERFEIHTRMLGWDDKWSFVEHRFVKDHRRDGHARAVPWADRQCGARRIRP